ncbi:GNAT family N-acetyltransferase [Shouchella xiaoxiensis]|uniref:GNAT family N-acetyltransferase n=1 Tax=Shouchella xiaoxiensis TaxID=766895 RepID=UPI003461C841
MRYRFRRQEQRYCNWRCHCPSYRKQGFGTELLISLFTQLLAEQKTPYLFYNNPAAKSVYEQIGMTEVCEWLVIGV